MREINRIIVHCADTPNGKHFTVEDIDSWHKERGFHRKPGAQQGFNPSLCAIGYHAVIYIDGSLHTGRSEEEIGAHAEGFNNCSLGVCMFGKDKFTLAQWAALKGYLAEKADEFSVPANRIQGHYQVATNGKTCPNFDVPAYFTGGMDPDPKHVL